jgi:hypothetical protein
MPKITTSRIFVMVTVILAMIGLYVLLTDENTDHERLIVNEAELLQSSRLTRTRPIDSHSPPHDSLSRIYGTPRSQTADKESQERVRKSLLEMDRDEALSLITEYLATGKNQNFLTAFMLRENGDLATAPNMRVLLIDLLGVIDLGTAAKMSREILESMECADEWAVSLRNTIRYSRTLDHKASNEEYSYARSKSEQMYSYRPWLDEPTIGFLEGFDFWVEFGDQQSLGRLLDLRNGDQNDSVKHASYIASHRIANRIPRTTVDYLSSPEILDALPPIQCGALLAKADPRDSQQMSTIADTLLNRNQDDPVVVAFFRYFPNFQEFVVPSLISLQESSVTATAHARATWAVQVMEEWLNMEEFQRHHRRIEQAQNRLKSTLEN